MTRCFSFINEKGGTSKTTLAVHGADYFARSGLRTLLLDMDPQGHVGKSLGISSRPREPNLFDVLVSRKLSLGEVVKSTKIANIFVAPSDKRMADFTINVVRAPDRHLRLARALEDLTGYDVTIIDSPPSLGIPVINILIAATDVIIPVPLNYLGLDGCSQVLKTIIRIKHTFSKNHLRIRAIVPVMHRVTRRQNLVLEKLREHFGNRVTQAIIPFDDTIDLAQASGRTVFEAFPDCPGAKGMAEVFEELLPSPIA